MIKDTLQIVNKIIMEINKTKYLSQEAKKNFINLKILIQA